MNRFSKFTAILTLAGFLSVPAVAAEFECEAGPSSEWLPKQAIVQSLKAKGFEVRKLEVEDGCYEIYALKDGRKLEIYVNPATGVIEKTKEK